MRRTTAHNTHTHDVFQRNLTLARHMQARHTRKFSHPHPHPGTTQTHPHTHTPHLGQFTSLAPWARDLARALMEPLLARALDALSVSCSARMLPTIRSKALLYIHIHTHTHDTHKECVRMHSHSLSHANQVFKNPCITCIVVENPRITYKSNCARVKHTFLQKKKTPGFVSGYAHKDKRKV